jgi:23S rRNA (adenine2030-N6)-methyltransferase
MNYHHSKHAGNAGDVWKHFCLLETVKSVVSGTGFKKRSYFESHCGIGRFELGFEEEWKKGIGIQKPIPSELSTTDYFQIAFQQLAKREYLGSWRWVDTTGAFTNYFLCDTNEKVIGAAKSNEDEAKGFHFAVVDGFNRLERLEPMDFLFIDPPYVESSDWKRLQELLPTLLNRHKHFLIWYPLLSGESPEEIFKGLERFEIRWGTQILNAKKMVGCGITGSLPCTSVLKNRPELNVLADWLSASFEYKQI